MTQTEESVLATRGSTLHPLDSLVASARRLTARNLGSRVGATGKSWQDDAWDMFGLVGEHHFLAVTLAGRMSQARLYIGKMSTDTTEAPVPVNDPAITSILDSIGSSASARAQMISRLGVNLFVAGDGWLVGIPRHLIPETLLVGPMNNPSLEEELLLPGADPLLVEAPADGLLSIEDLEWRMLSVSEVTANAGGEVQIQLGETEDEKLRVNPDKIFLIRVWRPHPRRWWEADSPTRSSLPVLRELVGLTMKISSQIDSRLAGAGVLFMPQSAQRALKVAAGLDEDSTEDPFTEALIEAMITPISDRANASAVVPLVVTVPDESIALFKLMTFDKPLDISDGERRDEAIRRLALGLDAPPELLLGTGGMNHWGAWLVLEDVVTTHLEPPLAIICDALTTQFLWPVLAEQGMTPQAAQDYVIWYDVSDLVVRPNRSTDAQVLHEKGVISDQALRTATGFDESDAPPQLPQEVELALAAITQAPSLLAAPGLPALVEQIRAALTGDTSKLPPLPAVVPVGTASPPAAGAEPAKNVPEAVPATQGAPAAVPPPGQVAASALGNHFAGVALRNDRSVTVSGGPIFIDDLAGRIMPTDEEVDLARRQAAAHLAAGGLLPGLLVPVDRA